MPPAKVETMRYRLSQLIPVRFRSTYGVENGAGSYRAERATWWQFRGRVFAHRRAVL